MFFLWICLSVFCALQSTVSSDQGVSLTCNKTVNATTGENVILTCLINWILEGEECAGYSYVWRNANGTKLCDNGAIKYACKWNNYTYVSLTILHVMEEEVVTVEISTTCGMDKSRPIRVQLISGGPLVSHDYHGWQKESTHAATAVLCVFASAAVVVILYFLYKTYKSRISYRTVTLSAPLSTD